MGVIVLVDEKGLVYKGVCVCVSSNTLTLELLGNIKEQKGFSTAMDDALDVLKNCSGGSEKS